MWNIFLKKKVFWSNKVWTLVMHGWSSRYLLDCTDVRIRSCQPMETLHSEWFTSTLMKLSWHNFSRSKGGTVQSLPASIRHHLPQEVLGSRWEVMELCGSVGGDMTSCQALMQANIWRLWATSFLACWRGPVAWSQKPPRGPEPGPRRQ